MQFHHIWTIYTDLISGRYVPSFGFKDSDEAEADWTLPSQIGPTMMFVLYAFFYSLIEDSEDGLDAFRIWRKKFPEEFTAIDALEKQVAPMRKDFRVFRNRLGFHGSRSLKHELSGYELFGNYSGTRVLESIRVFKSLNAALLMKDLARQHNSNEEMGQARLRLDSIPARCDELARM